MKALGHLSKWCREDEHHASSHLHRCAARLGLRDPHVPRSDDDGSDHHGLIIADACRWHAFQVTSIDDARERVEIECSVVNSGRLRDFVGWNRAMHAVLEAAILATRVDFLEPQQMSQQLGKLATIVDKTASQRERNAFQIVQEFVSDKMGSPADKLHR